MRTTRRRGPGTGAGAAALLLVVASLARALPGDGQPREAGFELARAADVAEIHAELEALDGEAFRERVRALLVEQPTEAARALVLRAGSDDPPGVNGARAERRGDRRQEGLALFRDDFAGGGVLPQELRTLLALPSPEAYEQDLLCAAMRVVSRLGLRSLTIDVAWNLGAGRPAAVREAARLALYELYGRWFVTSEEFEAAWPQLTGRPPEALFVAEFKRLAERERELLGAVLAHEPARSAEVFERGHPEARAIAARELVRAVRLKQLEIPVALERLRARLDVEVDPRAYQAAIDATLELLQGQAPDAPAIDALREQLEEHGVRRGAFAVPLVQALARIPWELEPREAGETGDARYIGRGLALLADSVAQLAETRRPVDYDRLSLAIEGLRGLAQRSGLSRDDRRAFLDPASEAVVNLALSGAGPLDARLDAARALDDFLDVDDLARVLELLQPSSSARPSLRLHLLGAVERLAPRIAPESEAAAAIRDVLGSSLRSEDVDIRRRALEMLAGEGFAPHVTAWIDGEGRGGLVKVLLDGFAVDTSARNQELRLELLARLGPDAELAGQLGASAGFDALIEANGRGATVLVQTLGRLVRGDAASTMVAARRLARIRSRPEEAAQDPVPSPGPDPLRRKLALRLVAGAGAETLASLSTKDRTTILRWALAQQLDRHGGAPLPSDLLPHVVEWVSSAEGSGLAEPDRTCGHALFLADLAGRQRAPGAPDLEASELVAFPRVREAFAEALRVAEAAAAPSTLRVRLARAHFAMSIATPPDPKAAAEDFAVLLAAEPEAPVGVELLADDLRKAAQAFDGARRPLDAARAELRLVRLPGWVGGTQEGHLEDLERLVERAITLADAELLRGVRDRLTELRAPRETEAEAGASDVFRRILEDPASRARFDALTVLLAQGPPPPSEGEESDDGQKPTGGGLIDPRK